MAFQFSTINDFDQHIQDSISGYDLLHQLILNVASFYVMPNYPVVDLGCTSGKLLNKLCETYQVKGVGFDIVDQHFDAQNGVELKQADISKDDFAMPQTSLALSVFTMQFLDVNDRPQLLKKIYDALSPAGAFICCEKVYSQSAEAQEAFTFANYQYKRENFSAEEILQKEQDLRTVMKPLNQTANEQMFKEAGFSQVEVFFKSLNFCGFLCLK
jgi:tRNA (cmo5U34)-methyltransferase